MIRALDLCCIKPAKLSCTHPFYGPLAQCMPCLGFVECYGLTLGGSGKHLTFIVSQFIIIPSWLHGLETPLKTWPKVTCISFLFYFGGGPADTQCSIFKRLACMTPGRLLLQPVASWHLQEQIPELVHHFQGVGPVIKTYLITTSRGVSSKRTHTNTKPFLPVLSWVVLEAP